MKLLLPSAKKVVPENTKDREAVSSTLLHDLGLYLS